jgi:hypothetical protein
MWTKSMRASSAPAPSPRDSSPAQGKKTDGAPFTAKVQFLAVLVKQNGQWQLAATQLSAVKVPQHSPN